MFGDMDRLTAFDNLFGPNPGATLNIIFHLISGGRDLKRFGPLSPRWQILSVNEDSSDGVDLYLQPPSQAAEIYWHITAEEFYRWR